MQYLCLAYYDEKKFDTVSKTALEAIVSECQPHDEALRKSGHLLAVASLQHRTATTLRPRNGKTSAIDGPFGETKEQIGDFDAAEEALHDAFTVTGEQWARDGVPANPRAWLVSTGRHKAIDAMRRRARVDASLTELAKQLESSTSDAEECDEESVEDDRLRLTFTCCHPALPPDAQVAMTLRQVCGLTTDEIARAFPTRPSTVARRIVRAKAKIRDARIPYAVPSETDLPDRLDAVLRVVYLVFNEGYAASSGGSLTRPDLSGEAIRLGGYAERSPIRV
jgi:RNA polymerase sigma factor (sigma-70 family)